MGKVGETRWTEQTVALIRGLEAVLGRGSLLAYLVHMTLRIVEIHRVLKPTGSFYLHCDPTASHYLKLVCDTIFVSDRQGGDFVNEIVWWYKRWSNASSNFQRMHDVILFYGKSKKDRTFNVQYQGYAKPEAIEDTVRGVIDGKLVRLKDEDGNYIKRKGENKGVACHDVFELQHIQPTAKERMGYPTQKPVALLERIIKKSSNEGDVVLDAYCGCGTSVAVAQRLGRRWIGIDITYQSIALILKRFADTYKDDWPAIEADIKLDGVPRDLESAMLLANRKDDKTRKEFEKWAVLTFSRNQARINEKKGADGGIDGIAYFLLDKDTNGKAIFQVKSGTTKRSDLATLNSDRLREKAEFGFLICTDLPTKSMRDEIAAAGKFRHPLLNREDDRLQVITVAELFDMASSRGKRLDLPMARTDAVKSAVAKGDADKQLGLI